MPADPGSLKAKPADCQDSAIRGVAYTLHIVLPGFGDKMADGHFITSEGTGFVRADDRHGTQSFHRRQLARDSVALDHALHADRQGDGHDRRQTFGYRGYGETDGRRKKLVNATAVQQPPSQKHRDSPSRELRR
jgi:hypothetical protein